MAHERVFGREKKSKEDEINLSRYSRNLSRRLLSADSGIIQPYISQNVMEGYQKFSIDDRNSHWEASQLNFGQQMAAWAGTKEGNGLSQWIEGQKDERVLQMLHILSLTGGEPVAEIVEEPTVASLLTTINNDLRQVGEKPLTADNLSESQARSLLFYADYFSEGAKETDSTRGLIESIVLAARSLTNDNPEQTEELLQKISPLLSLAGEEAQHTLGAILVTEMHLKQDWKAVSEGVKEPLSDDEQQIVNSLAKYGVEFPDVENIESPAKPLVLGQKYNTAKILAELKPATLGKNPYIVEHIPSDSAKKLEADFSKLEQSKPLFINVNYVETQRGLLPQPNFNRDVFDPAYTLEHNGRFQNAEWLTYKDSGVFALAAASAKTPEEQAKLYHQLAEVVVAVHEKNPELLEKFLNAQTTGSMDVLANNDVVRGSTAVLALQSRIQQEFKRDFEEKFHIDPETMQEQPNASQQAFIDDANKRLATERAALLKNFSGDADRLVSVQHIEPAEDDFERFPLQVLIPETIQGWKESGRIEKLSKLLKEENPEFTPEEIRQIEFLAHSVDVVKVIKWMQNNETFPIDLPENSVPSNPETPPVVPLPQSEAPTEAVPAENENRTVTLEEFLSEFSETTNAPARRNDLLEGGPLELAEFSSKGEDITHYENLDNTGNLAIFSLSGAEITLADNPFFNLMKAPGSFSEASLDYLAGEGFDDAVLLAFSLEAANTVSLQANVFKNLFLQTVELYNTHPDLREHYLHYTTSIQESGVIDSPLENAEKTTERLNELAHKLRNNDVLTKDDISDMNIYALPIDLKYLAHRMNIAYRNNEAKK